MKVAFALIASLAATSIASAAPPTGSTASQPPVASQPGAEPKGNGVAESTVRGDPNRTICKSANPTGSRLSKKRTCMTAREWGLAKQDTRTAVERGQTLGNVRQ